MPSPESLRIRVQLIHTFDQLAERLANGDASAIEEAQDRIAGLAICDDPYVLSLVMRAMARVLTDQQEELDRGGWTYHTQ